MTAYCFLEELRKHLEVEMQNSIGLTNGNEEVAIPKVFNGYLPMKKAGAKDKEREDYPYIIIRLKKASDDFETNTLSIQLILGIYRNDETGCIDLLHLYEAVRKSLLGKRLFGAAVLEPPLELEIDESQGLPYFVGVIKTKFTVATYDIEGVEF